MSLLIRKVDIMLYLISDIHGVTDEVTKLGCSIIAEEWESYDELLRQRKDLRRGWYIVRKDET